MPTTMTRRSRMPQTTVPIKSHDCSVVYLTSACSSLRDTELSSVSSSSSLPPSPSSSVASVTSWRDSESERAAVAIRDWMYWQRESDANTSCWTKVYAVLRGEFLWLYQRAESAPKSLLLQLAVANVEVAGDRQLRVIDPNGEDITLCLLSAHAFQSWCEQLRDAAALTDTYFRFSCLGASDLPRGSFFRGTLVAYRQRTARKRCRAAMSTLACCWKRYMQSTRTDASEPSSDRAS